ncbi:hypothetical protein [Corynebacterium sp.]|nr:hypothetical protein [Corynebacterium sp.]MDO5077734.1 hypothetical protein [Corynebacterium sp.]
MEQCTVGISELRDGMPAVLHEARPAAAQKKEIVCTLHVSKHTLADR